jgi:hypothetical protein
MIYPSIYILDYRWRWSNKPLLWKGNAITGNDLVIVGLLPQEIEKLEIPAYASTSISR